MPVEIALSANAVAVLRFEIRGWRAKNKESRLPAYRELAAAGVMEPVPGSETDYRFTEDGLRQREEILAEAQDRIERERYNPPDASDLSEAARALLRRIVSGERLEVTRDNRPAFRELAVARIIYLRHTFARGDESGYRFTYWGWKQRFDILDCAKAEAR
jgi:antitoxin (DNA-binding transcriptional repressor) of toxin-antitoxin stability system